MGHWDNGLRSLAAQGLRGSGDSTWVLSSLCVMHIVLGSCVMGYCRLYLVLIFAGSIASWILGWH